jgi:hypothetical protein
VYEGARRMRGLSGIPTGVPSRGQRLVHYRHQVPLTTALARALGVIWIIDGLLQLQPAQFSPGFALGIEMNAMAQPSAIAHLELAFGRLTSTSVAPWTVLIAVVQLLLGTAMLSARLRRPALLASVPWALAVWALGEGFGGIATGYAMLPTGAPGAALVYALVAVLLLLDQRSGDRRATRRKFACAWTALWVSAAGLQLGSHVPLSLMLRANFNEVAGNEPRVLAGLDHRLAEITGTHAIAATALLTFVELLLACAPWISRRRATLVATLVVLVIFWVAGENLGGVLTWSASDVGTTPLLALIALGAYDARISARLESRTGDDRSTRPATPRWRDQRAAVFVAS